MDIRYINYRRRVFQEWKRKVSNHIPYIAIQLYTSKLSGIYVDRDIERNLGKVIRDINNPFYGITDDNMNHLDEIGEISSEVILEILVNEVFGYVKSKCKQNKNQC